MRRQILILSLLSAFAALTPAMAQDQTAHNINMLRTKAVEAQFNGDPDAALGTYQQALELAKGAYGDKSPFLAELYFDMGSLCLNVARFPKAEEYLSQTVKLSPNSSAAHLRLAELKRLQGRPEEAAKHASAVIAKHRDDVAARQELAIDYERSDDNLRAYHELSAMEQLVQHNKAVYEGRETNNFVPKISFAPSPIKLNVSPALTTVTPPAKPSAEEQKKAQKAEADKKKAEEERKKAQANAEKLANAKAAQEKKKAQLKAEQDKRKAEQEKKKAAELAKKKAAPPKAATTTAVAPAGDIPATGIKANLSSKAVLLTPVSKATPAKPAAKPAKPVVKAAPPPSNSSEEPDESIDEGPKKPATPPPAPKKEAKPAAPKPGKHAPGLVPPPPPVMNFPVMTAPPQMQAPPPKPKAAAPKKEEKPKEAAPAKEEKEPEDDFLLDWGGAKPKKK